MTITVEATYENGTLKLVEPLPLKEHEKVRVTVELEPSPLLCAVRDHGVERRRGNHRASRPGPGV